MVSHSGTNSKLSSEVSSSASLLHFIAMLDAGSAALKISYASLTFSVNPTVCAQGKGWQVDRQVKYRVMSAVLEETQEAMDTQGKGASPRYRMKGKSPQRKL